MQITFNNKIYSSEDLLIEELKKLDATKAAALIWEPSGDIARGLSFIEKLCAIEPPLACSIHWYQSSLEGLIPCYHLRRYQFISETYPSIQQILQHTSKTVIRETRIRQAKLDLGMDSTHAQELPLQQQQQQQQSEDLKRRPKPKRIFIKASQDTRAPIPVVDTSELKDVITRDNIQSELQGFYQDQYPRISSENLPSLLEIWDNLVGKGAKNVPDKSRTITGIKRDVLKQLIKHYAEQFLSFEPIDACEHLPVMKDALGVIDNLPVIKDVLGHITGRLQLCCDATYTQYVLRFMPQEELYSIKVNKFTISLEPVLKRPERVDIEALGLSEEADAALREIMQATTNDNVKSLWDTLLRNIPEKDSRLLESVRTAYQKLDAKLNQGLHAFLKDKPALQAAHYRCLVDLLVYGGLPGVWSFFNNLNEFQDIRLIYRFLHYPSNMQQWASKDGLARLNVLKKFNDAERAWWIALVEHHQQAGWVLNFNVLFDAFDDFRTQLRADKDLSLPLSFPGFQNVGHIQPALERLLYIIQHGPGQDQINRLRNLELGPLGHYYGSRFERMPFVAADPDDIDMGLLPEYAVLEIEGRPQPFSYDMSDPIKFKTCMNLRPPAMYTFSLNEGETGKIIGYEATKYFYYRYVFRHIEGRAFDANAHKEIVRLIEQLGQHLAPSNSKTAFLFKTEGEAITERSLDARYRAGYVCLKNDAGQPVSLYFIDRNQEPPEIRNIDERVSLSALIQDLSLKDQQRLLELTPEQQSRIENYTHYHPMRSENCVLLKNEQKASLLYIVAVATSGRQTTQNAPLEKQLKNFLEALQLLAKKLQVKPTWLIEEIHRQGLNPNTCPSLSQFANLLKLIPEPSAETNKRQYAKEAIQTTVHLMNQDEGTALVIFEVYKARYERGLKEREWATPHFLDFMQMFQSVYTDVSNVRDDKLTALFFKVKPILALVLMEANYVEKARKFMQTLRQLPENVQNKLIELLSDINLQTSKELPTFQSLHQLCGAVHEAVHTEPLSDELDEKLSLLIQRLLSCQIGRARLDEATIDFISVFRKFAAQDGFDDAPSVIKQGILNAPLIPKSTINWLLEQLAPILSLLTEFKQEIDKNEPNEETLIKLLDNIDDDIARVRQNIFKWLGEWPGNTLIQGLLKFGKSQLPGFDQSFDDYAKQFLISAFIAPVLKTECIQSLRQQFDNLQLGYETCDIAWMPEPFLEAKLAQLPLKAAVAYIRCGKQLFYFDKSENKYELIDADKQLPQFDQLVNLKKWQGNGQAAAVTKLDHKQLEQIPAIIHVNRDKYQRFANYLFEQIESKDVFSQENLSKSSQVLNSFKPIVQDLNQFFNTLIRLRNDDSSDFQACIDKLLCAQLYSRFSFKDFSRLINVLGKLAHLRMIFSPELMPEEFESIKQLPGIPSIISESHIENFNQLVFSEDEIEKIRAALKSSELVNKDEIAKKFICEIPISWYLGELISDLQDSTRPGEHRYLGCVLDGLSELSQCEGLSKADLEKSFKDSVTHNFRHHDAPFSFGGQIAIKKMCDNFEFAAEHERELFRKALYRAYELIKNSPKTDGEQAEVFLQQTNAKIKDKMPCILPFMLHVLPSISSPSDVKTYYRLLDTVPTDESVLSYWSTIFSTPLHGKTYTLSDLTYDEFVVLQSIVKDKKLLNSATKDNYREVIFTSEETQNLMQALATSELKSKLTQGPTLNELTCMAEGLVRHQEQLACMCEVLFEGGEPYPERTSWLEALSQDEKRLQVFQEEFDRHPYGRENWQKMRQSYRTDAVIPVIMGIRRLSDNQPLSAAQQRHLKQQFDYVNALCTSGCDIIRIEESIPHQEEARIRILQSLQLKTYAAYVRWGSELIYFDEINQTYQPIMLNQSQLNKFDETFKASAEAVTLTESQLAEIKQHTGHFKPTYKLHPVDQNGNPMHLQINGELQSAFELSQCSRKTLKLLARRLTAEFKSAERKANQDDASASSLSAATHRTLVLQLLAVYRALYYRSASRVPNSTQVLTLIYALDHGERQLFGINTGEGKSITTALFASLLAAKGGTAFIPTANRSLVQQDYDKKHNDRFFQILGFQSAKIDNNSGEEDFHVGGIHYGTDGDLSNFCSKAALKGWVLYVDQDGYVCPWVMVKDEYDYSMDDRRQFKYAIPKPSKDDLDTSDAWIYFAANEFVKGEAFRNRHQEDAWDEKEDIRQFLEVYLQSLVEKPKGQWLPADNYVKRPSANDMRAHIQRWLPEFNHLINDACDACNERKFVEGRDFFVSDVDEYGRKLGYTLAVPYSDKVPQWGSTFPRHQHACLHARLQCEKQGAAVYPFPIDPEQFAIASRSSTGFMHWFKVIIGLTGTPGSANELLEQNNKFGMYATAIPPHKAGKRLELAPVIVKAQDMDQAIMDAILYHSWYESALPLFAIRFLEHILSLYQTLLQTLRSIFKYEHLPEKPLLPILIITENPNQAKALYKKLHAEYGDRVQKITGEETNETRQEMLLEAAKDGKITVSTSYSGRGTDIDAEIFVIDTCEDSFRNTRQIKGRAARQGKNGKYLAIYPAENFKFSSWLSRVFGLSQAESKKQIESHQEKLGQENAVRRYYLQEVDEVQQIILNQFDAWMSALLGESGKNRDVCIDEQDEQAYTLYTYLIEQRGILVQKLNDGWQDCLSHSAEHLPSNPYVMYDIEGKLMTEHLDNAFSAFKIDVINSVWKEIQKSLEDTYQRLKARHDLSFSSKDNARIESLKQDDISESFNYRKFRLYRKRVKHPIVSAMAENRMARQLQLVSSEAWAVAHYDEQLNEESRTSLLQEYAKTYLDWVYRQSSMLKKLDNQKENIEDRLYPLVDYLQEEVKNKSFKMRQAIQSVAFECVSFYDAMCKHFPKLKKSAAFSSAVNEIRHAYLNDSSIELAEELLTQLNWTKRSNSFYYRNIEYTQVMEANQEICKLASVLQEAKSNIQRDRALQVLHQALVKHQYRLNRMWYYFPFGSYFFGYPDIRVIIAQALAHVEALVEFNHYDAETQYRRNEAGQCEVYLEDFWAELENVNVSALNWPSIKLALREIYTRNDQLDKKTSGFAGLFVIDELLDYLQFTVKVTFPDQKFIVRPTVLERIDSLFRSTPNDAVERLIERLKVIKQTIKRDHPGYNPLCSELFVRRKESQLKTSLKELMPENQAVWDSMHLEVKSGHTGFKPYYEVMITSDHYGAIPVENFVRDPRREKIKHQLQEIEALLEALDNEIEGIKISEQTTPAPIALPKRKENGWGILRRRQVIEKSDVVVLPEPTEAVPKHRSLRSVVSGFVSWVRPKSNTSQGDELSTATASNLESQSVKQAFSFSKITRALSMTRSRAKHQVAEAGHSAVLDTQSSEGLLARLQLRKEMYIAKQSVLHERLAQCSPNLMSRRFETLGEFLDFERALYKQAETLRLTRTRTLKEMTVSSVGDEESVCDEKDDVTQPELESADDTWSDSSTTASFVSC